MTGLFLLAVVGGWIWVSFALARAAARKVGQPWRALAAVAIFLTLLVLPLVDEVIGAYQFRQLCQSDADFRIKPEKARDKTVRVVIQPANEVVPGTALRVLHSHGSLRVINTDEEIAQYDRYVVQGGWLIRALGISESDSPLTIGSPYCGPKVSPQGYAKEYGFTIIREVKRDGVIFGGH